MYAKYFGLSETPFRITPDPRFLWYSNQHQEAKAKIEYHLSQKDGPVYLSAQVGLGKTSIAKRLRDEFAADKTKQVVLVFAPNLRTANQFMRFIAEEFQVKTARSYADTLKNFERFLIDQYKAGITPILLVDEAQNLPHDTLKTIHHLFNFTTNNRFLIQIALFGQPELHKRIKRFRSLYSRMYMAKLQPFDLKQTRSMMKFRWTVAGGKQLPFDKQSIEEIYRLTGGIARDICKLANEALLRAVVGKKKLIDKKMVSTSATDAFEEAR
jgi:general secretion pathway protein A